MANRFSAVDIAVCAVTVALLIGGQLLFSMIAGVEIVTVLLLCFAYSFGVRRGVLTATAFSLLRCLVFGFDVKTVFLYLIYFNFFAFLFGTVGRKNGTEKISLPSAVATELLFILLCGVAVVFLSGIIKISVLLVAGLQILSRIILALGIAGFAVYNLTLLFAGKYPLCLKTAKTVSVVVAGAVCTISFTLLDDILYPLFYGVWGNAAVVYFYASFTAMLPQTLCTVVTVSLLFCPLTKIFDSAAKKYLKIN